MKKKRLIIFFSAVLIILLSCLIYRAIDDKQVIDSCIGYFVDTNNIYSFHVDGVSLVDVNIEVQSGEMIETENGSYEPGISIEDTIKKGNFKKVKSKCKNIQVNIHDNNGNVVKKLSINNGEKINKLVWLSKGDYNITIDGDGFSGMYSFEGNIYTMKL